MDDYLRILATVKSCPKSFQSDFCRGNSSLVAEAASRNHISCLGVDGRNVGCWEITASGVKFLKATGGCR